jgi:hypothetical protein
MRTLLVIAVVFSLGLTITRTHLDDARTSALDQRLAYSGE